MFTIAITGKYNMEIRRIIDRARIKGSRAEWNGGPMTKTTMPNDEALSEVMKEHDGTK